MTSHLTKVPLLYFCPYVTVVAYIINVEVYMFFMPRSLTHDLTACRRMLPWDDDCDLKSGFVDGSHFSVFCAHEVLSRQCWRNVNA